MHVLIASRIILAWIVAIAITISALLEPSPYYRFGPHPDLIVLGFHIDTSGKYSAVMIYCLFNTAVRSMVHNILHPWITLTIQDTSPEMALRRAELSHRMAYEVTIVYATYLWFDWFIYINLLLAQFDLMLMELVMEVIASCVIAWRYLNGV
jgi:hypothetical protein